MKKFSLSIILIGFCLLVSLLFIAPAHATSILHDDFVAHGQYIATIAGCTTCHTPYLPEYQDMSKLTPDQIKVIAFDERPAQDRTRILSGGRLFDLGPAGKVYSANITPDKETGIGNWTDEQIKTAVRTGEKPTGSMLFPVMPYHNYNTMADADLDAVIAFLHTMPAVKNVVPARTVSVDGLKPLPYTQGIVAPDPANKAARGEYLIKSVTGCTDCHTPVDPATGAPIIEKYLAGGQPYEGPWGIVYGGNITPDKETGIGNFSESDIIRALTSGVNTKGRRLILMPWFVYDNLSAQDASAIAYYNLNGLPAVKNEIPAPSIKPEFNVLTMDAPANQPTNSNQGTYITIAVVVVLALVVVIVLSALFLTRPKRSA